LCHNSKCFNPEHLVVEDAAQNKARNTCKEAIVLTLPDGTSFNPCRHWKAPPYKRCVLPEFRAPVDMRGRFLTVDPDQGGYVKVATLTSADFN